MIKKIKRPDGTEETLEGTPEEIAALERGLVRNDESISPKKGNRKLLKEELLKFKEEIDSLHKRVSNLESKPIQLSPWPNDLNWKNKKSDDFCLAEECAKTLPPGSPIGIVCPCPKCTIICSIGN